MILCGNCGASLVEGAVFCGECGERNPAFPEPPPPAPAPPTPTPPFPPDVKTNGGSGDSKTALILFGLVGCFIVGALVATAILLNRGGATNSQNNTNYTYANTNYSANANADRNTNVYSANTSNMANTSVSNTNVYANRNGGYGNMNSGNTNRRPSMSPYDNAEYKLLNNYYLTNSEVSGLSAYQLKLLRNTVFAKYGRVFNKDPDLQTYFDNKSWYTRNENYTKSTDYVELTAADEANLDIIKAAEAVYTSP